jgi:carbamate kinase
LVEALTNELPGRDIAAVFTQIEVDPNDPAFKTPTKPIGPFYDHPREELQPMVQVGSHWRKVVASPLPKRILGVHTVKSLITLGNIVICCGGGGVPVVYEDSKQRGIAAVIDKDHCSALLASNLNADALIILTDVESCYTDFGKPTQARVPVLKTSAVDNHWLESLPQGSIRPKVEASLQFVRQTGGWAAIGSLDKLSEIMIGSSGTRVIP